MKLHSLAFASSGAIISAVIMLLLGVLGPAGMYGSAHAQMMQWHMYYGPTTGGVMAGMLEAAILTFIFCYAFAGLYNMLVDSMKK